MGHIMVAKLQSSLVPMKTQIFSSRPRHFDKFLYQANFKDYLGLLGCKIKLWLENVEYSAYRSLSASVYKLSFILIGGRDRL